MALTIVSTPAFGLCRDSIWLRLKSDNYRTAAGVAAVYDLVVPAAMTVGQSFDLTFDGKRYRFVVAASPNGGGYEIRSYASSPAFTLMVADVASNYYLSENYTMVGTYASNKIRFTAKAVGTAYALGLENAAAGVSLSVITAGVDNTFRSNFKCFVDVHEQADFTAAAVSNKIAQLDADGHKDAITGALAADEYVFDFELQGILRSLLSAYVPTAAETLTKVAAGVMANYWLRYGEIYGDDPLINQNAVSGATANNYYQVLLGGWRTDDTKSTLNTAIVGTAWMNQQPSVKVVAADNAEFLFKYVTAAATNLQLHYKLYYRDGTTASGVTGTAVGTSLAKTIYVFPAGFDLLNLGAVNAAKTCWKYELYVTNDVSAVLSNTQTYVLDYNTYEEETVLMFLGAAGAMETVWCHGYKKTELVNDSVGYEVAKMPWYAKGDELLMHANSSQRTKTTYYTGYKSLDYINWLKDLAQSDTVVLLDGTSWAGVRLVKDSIKDMPTGLDDFYALSFELERIEKR
jgi:hypothetical protein